MKLKKLRKKVQRIYAETLKLQADLKAAKRRAKSKVASDIESPPGDMTSERVAKTQELNQDDTRFDRTDP